MNKNKQADLPSDDGKYIISAPIVHKPFIKKNGQPTNHGEWYIRRSVQDYFIKFCESAITQEELTNALAQIDSPIKVLNLEVEFCDGEWDICDGNFGQQSRIGEYVVVHRIVS